MHDYDLVIENGTIVDPVNGVKEGLRIGIKGERIAIVGGEPNGKRHIDASECYVFPGFIDPHGHLRDDEWAEKETYKTGTRAAAHGGVTTVFDMPNLPNTPTVTRERVLGKIAKAKADGIVDILVFGGVTKDNIDTLPEMADVVCGYKIFTCKSTGGLYLPYEYLERALKRVADTGKVASIHCEDEPANVRFSEALKGRNLPTLLKHNLSRPSASEVTAIIMALDAAKSTGAKVNICHVSTAEGAKLIREARDGGLNVTYEVTPHHLLLDTDYGYSEFRDWLTVNPPLRSEAERNALRAMLFDTYDFMLASDHAPHTQGEKKGDNPPSGIPSLDRFGHLLYPLFGMFPTNAKTGWDASARKYYFASHHQAIAHVTSYNAAQRFGLSDRGGIDGSLADLVVLKKNTDRHAPRGTLYTKCQWSPYEHMVDSGSVRYTIKRGKVIAHDGRVIERPGEELV